MTNFYIIAQCETRETSVDIATCDNKHIAILIAKLLNNHIDLQDDSALTLFALGQSQKMTARVYTGEDMEEVYPDND